MCITGYTTGTFDLFHIGHLNILRNAKALCDTLIVGVSCESILDYKSKPVIISLEHRIEIVRNIKHVDIVIPQYDIDKFKAWKNLHYDILFVGDSWRNTKSWNYYEKKLREVNVQIVYLPYTKSVSTTNIVKQIKGII